MSGTSYPVYSALVTVCIEPTRFSIA
jgi:hypothetical protein